MGKDRSDKPIPLSVEDKKEIAEPLTVDDYVLLSSLTSNRSAQLIRKGGDYSLSDEEFLKWIIYNQQPNKKYFESVDLQQLFSNLPKMEFKNFYRWEEDKKYRNVLFALLTKDNEIRDLVRQYYEKPSEKLKKEIKNKKKWSNFSKPVFRGGFCCAF